MKLKSIMCGTDKFQFHLATYTGIPIKAIYVRAYFDEILQNNISIYACI